MKLTNPDDVALNTAFALEVAGWRTEISGCALMYYDELGTFRGGRNDGKAWAGIPCYTQSADLVLPWLEKWTWRGCSYRSETGSRFNATVEVVNKGLDLIKAVSEKSFAHAAVIALLRAHGIEIEFS